MNTRLRQSLACIGSFAACAGVGLVVASSRAESPARPAGAAATQPGESKMAESQTVTVRTISADGTLSPPHAVPKFVLSDEEWRKRLTPEQYRITRSAGTERAFCGGLLNNKDHGLYVCVGCNLPLFESKAKFESGTGWPSFYQPTVPENVATVEDRSHGMVRTEINCARCDGHLGHVFDDGPAPTGLRYCLNSEALRFVKDADLKTLAEPAEPADAKP